jgi:heavy metal sensor kinase
MQGRISISLRLTLWFGGIFLIGWLLFGGAMWLVLKTTLKNERRQTLTRRIDRLEELLSRDADQTEPDRYQDFKDFAHATGNGLSEVFGSTGARAYPSPSSAAQSFPWPKARADAEQFVHVEAGGQFYWVYARPIVLSGQTMILMAAAPETGNLLVLQSFWRGLLAAAPILLLLSSLGGYWVSRRALAPVDRITSTARSIGIRNLSERLPVDGRSDELQRLAITCNAMFDRLDRSVRQIKQFTADASHELRGPLSFTRTVAEVALRNPHVDPASRVAFEDIVEEVAKAATLLDEMLTLARADAEPFAIVLKPLDLVPVLRDACAMAQPIALERRLAFAADLPLSAPMLGDETSLRRLTWILLDNALKYTPPGGRIDLSLTLTEDEATLQVRDTGVGIGAQDLPHIFDRFYRADPSRAMVEGNGLGLAIARWIAETHTAALTVTSAEGLGTTFQCSLPRLSERELAMFPQAAASSHMDSRLPAAQL